MKFKAGQRRKPIEYEKDIALQWSKDKTFDRSVEQRSANNQWVFYDGPPFLTGTPHHGHLLISTVKDAMGRFHAMKGQRVERRWGWDCHGLPAEVYVEKQLGIKSKKEIGTTISISEYVRKCREAMVRTGTEWEDTIERLGRWVEFEGAYKTMDPEYMESVWWAFTQLYNDGKIYEGEKVLIYCTKDATPISKSEVAMENSYQDDTDPSIFVYFKLEESDEYLLAWTTMAWTLPANVLIAVNKEVEYSLVEYAGKRFYVASDTVSRVMQDEKHQPLEYTVLKQVKGKELVNRRYEPLFEGHGPKANCVVHADFVTTEDGSGIVHITSSYGEDDYELCRREGTPMVSIVDANGNFTEGRWQGQNIWEANKQIAKTFVDEGGALKIQYFTHSYPHCHRCGGKLMYRAHPSWFMDIQSQKREMLAANAGTHWVPEVLRTGRFNNVIEQAPDWNLSRDRYWATPIPVWKGVRNDGTEVVKVFGSYDEFEKCTGKRLEDYHLPEVMDITFELDDTEMRHIGKVLDCWFESGSMPFAQFHYPFENKVKFEHMFPADFIIEAIDQTRGWFYSLLAVNIGLFDKAPWKNLICTGFINAADGKKMSKKLKNYTDPIELMDKFSADSFRFLMLSSTLTNGENFSLADKDVSAMVRKLGMVWNMYDFFTLYADADGWEWDGKLEDPSASLTNPLDVWIISRLHQLVAEVEERTEAYDLQSALRPILPFIDDASNWYVRCSRRRFWKNDEIADKANAYRTLHYVLVQLAHIMAPFTPFLAEELFQKLTGGELGESIHLRDWPTGGAVNESVLEKMSATRAIITEALAQRAEAGIKVRQPLHQLFVNTSDYEEEFIEIIREETNVKELAPLDVKARVKEPGRLAELPNGGSSVTKGRNLSGRDISAYVKLDTRLTPELKREGMVREVVRHIQNERKKAGLQVDDRIELGLSTSDDGLREAITEHHDVIATEALATKLGFDQRYKHSANLAVDGSSLMVSFQKVT